MRSIYKPQIESKKNQKKKKEKYDFITVKDFLF